MKRPTLRIAIVSLTVLLFACGLAVAARQSIVNNDEISIAISPSVIKLSSAGGSVSVHTNIIYASADGDSILLDGLSPYLVKSDDCGYLVAKFDKDAVKEMVAVPSATLVFSGTLDDGSDFAVSDTVKVIE